MLSKTFGKYFTVFACSLAVQCLSGCSDDKLVVLQPGAFSNEWPTALRGKLLKSHKCIVDQINGTSPTQRKLIFKSGENLKMAGWAFGESDEDRPIVYVQLVGPALTYTAMAQNRTLRPDVNGYFHLAPSKKTGFELEASQQIEPNEYEIHILMPGKDAVAVCETDNTIRIAPSATSR